MYKESKRKASSWTCEQPWGGMHPRNTNPPLHPSTEVQASRAAAERNDRRDKPNAIKPHFRNQAHGLQLLSDLATTSLCTVHMSTRPRLLDFHQLVACGDRLKACASAKEIHGTTVAQRGIRAWHCAKDIPSITRERGGEKWMEK